MLPVGFEPVIPASALLQPHALEGATAGISYNRTQALLSVLKATKDSRMDGSNDGVRDVPPPYLTSYSSSAALTYIYYPKTSIVV
jgi:hypothetical protein